MCGVLYVVWYNDGMSEHKNRLARLARQKRRRADLEMAHYMEGIRSMLVVPVGTEQREAIERINNRARYGQETVPESRKCYPRVIY